MKVPAIPQGPSEATPEWFTAVLHAGGALDADGRVTAVEPTRVGNGLVGESVRFVLSYAAPTAAAAPTSVVCKFGASDAEIRKVGRSELVYLREVRFYQRIAATVGIRTPKIFLAAIDDMTHDFVLVMEDLGPARGGDQIVGCSVADAAVVMDAAAALHGPRWADPSIEGADWDLRAEKIPLIQAGYPRIFARYRELFGHVNTAEELAIGERFVPVIERWFAGQRRPWTVTHGDFRLDNMLFDVRGGAEPLAVVDWQTILPGPGVSDVSYFLGGCLSVEDRRAHERALLRRYHEALGRFGVKGYDFERCWQEYRYNAFMGYYVCSFEAPIVPRTERGDRMFATWLSRTSRQILDLDVLSLLP